LIYAKPLLDKVKKGENREAWNVNIIHKEWASPIPEK
jgi:hypothetical protein